MLQVTAAQTSLLCQLPSSDLVKLRLVIASASDLDTNDLERVQFIEDVARKNGVLGYLTDELNKIYNKVRNRKAS